MKLVKTVINNFSPISSLISLHRPQSYHTLSPDIPGRAGGLIIENFKKNMSLMNLLDNPFI